MMRRAVLIVAVVVAATLTLGGGDVFHQSGVAYGLPGRAARGLLPQRYVRFGRVVRPVPMLSAGTRISAIEALHPAAPQRDGVPVLPVAVSLGCSNRTSAGDVRVNQDCTLRRQAEEDIAFNPLDPQNLIAGQNDSSIGWNHCAFDYSLDGGKRWGTGIPPFYERLNHPTAGHTVVGGPGSGHTYDAASDPSVTFDSSGNAYFSCILFDINGNASGLLVARSPTGADGSFYNDVPAAFRPTEDLAHYVVVEDDSSTASADKEFMTADSFRRSPYRDNVYVTWTEFISSKKCSQGGECFSSIYFSRSTDHARTWSKPVEISGNNPSICFDGNLFDQKRKAHDCDLDQGSQPVVLPNGSIVVVFNNGNTRGTNPNQQQLAVISKDGGRFWSRPVLVGRDAVSRQPQCNFGSGGEECIPGSFIRVDDFPRAAVDRSNGDLYTVWNDYRDGRYDIRLSTSNDGGFQWKESARAVDSAYKDSYMASVGVSSINHDLAIGYYSTDRVPQENRHSGVFKPSQPGVAAEGSRFLLAVSESASGPFRSSAVTPWFGAPDGEQAGFNGDYTGVTVVGVTAHPIWSDTRNVYRTATGSFSDEDVFTTTRRLP